MKERGVGHSEKLKSKLLRHHTLYNHAMKTSSNNFFVEMSAAEYRSIMGLDTPRRTPEPEKKNKYGAIKTEVGGLVFDSKKESMEWARLSALQRAGKIRDLERQKRFILQDGFVNNKGERIRPICYVSDFSFYDVEQDSLVAMDTKSKATRTPVYLLKKKMFEYKFPQYIFVESL